MRHPFIDFLIERDFISANIGQHISEKTNYVREPIGMIAVNHGLLCPTQIDRILDEQRTSTKRFGDIAVELDCLTREQVDRLIQIQEFRTSVAIAESLALAGVLSCEDAVQYLGSFLVNNHEVAAMIAEG